MTGGQRDSIETPIDALWHLFTRIEDLVTVVDLEGRFVYVNETALPVLGMDPDECVGQSAFRFIHQDDRERTEREFAGWIAAPEHHPFRHVNRLVNASTGSERAFAWSIHPSFDHDGELIYLSSSARDITDVLAAEARAKQGAARLRAVLAGMLDAVVTIDPFGTIKETSDSVHAIFGYEPAELVGRNVKLLMPEPYRSEHDGYLERYRQTGETWILGSTREFEVVHKQGHRVAVELAVSQIDVPGSDEPLFCGAFRDITERRETEQRLAVSEERLRAVFEQEFQYVGMLDVGGRVLEVNRSAAEIAGVDPASVRGLPFWEAPWWQGRSSERVRDAVDKARNGEFVRFEVDLRARDGEPRSVDFSIKPVLDDDGRVTMLLPEGRDITEMKRAQRRETAMFRALASVGESAAVLAHEIKNPITAVNLALRAVADQIGEEHAVVLGELAERMQRLERIMRETLSFAKPLELDRAAVEPQELLDEVAATLAPQIGSNGIDLEVDVSSNARLDIDREKIHGLLTNLVVNACEALENGGTVRLVSEDAGSDAEGSWVALAVEDDGPGLAEDDVDRLFQPFVSTKGKAGTGLGLAIARKIAEEHGGRIVAGASELGGASFRVVLPAAAD